MAKYQPYYERFRRKNYVPVASIALVFFTGAVGLWLGGSHIAPLNETASPAVVATDVFLAKTPAMNDRSAQYILSSDDRTAYKLVFHAQKTANWKLADEYISDLDNDILLGDILAERYLHRHYNTSKSEIVSWLKNYSDSLQAAEIVELAIRKYPELAATLPKLEKPRRLQGYGDGNGDDLRFDGNSQAKNLWLSGLDAWRTDKKSEAAKNFSKLADNNKELSDWQYSAASFWAYRSYLASGEKTKATEYLTKAATNPRVFYGILARKQLGKPLELDTAQIKMNVSDVRRVLAKPEVKKVIAFAQSGLSERAESRLRLIFPSATKQEKWVLLSLADRLNLPSTQISMAKQLESSTHQLDALKYPIPRWQPSGGFNIDPPLIYALMRQESGFHAAAESPSGALGLMQLMPQTAKKMHKSDVLTREMHENISEPVLNITLGERYVKHLLNNGLVNGNLFYMLTAYNAGAGKLKEWKDNIDYNNDPLLFVETIPYAETRHYILQVMTNYWIYSELSGVESSSLSALLRGNWPNYFPVSAPVADAGRRNRDS